MESQLPFVWQFLFEFLDRGEEVARFFNAGDNFVGAEFQKIGLFSFLKQFVASSQVTGVDTVGSSLARSE